MADRDQKKGAKTPESLTQVAAKLLIPGVTDETVVSFYNEWASNGYDQVVVEAASKQGYDALKVLQQAMKDLFPSNKETVVILDVGAGTGLSGQMMREAGFQIMDGLDPSAGMLEVAQGKRIYRQTYTKYLTGQPTDIQADSYDCVTIVGAIGHGCLPSSAFEEMTRLVKPGGYIVTCMRRAYLTEVEDYGENWEALKARMVQDGRWKMVRMDPYPNHFMGHEGLLMVIQILR